MTGLSGPDRNGHHPMARLKMYLMCVGACGTTVALPVTEIVRITVEGYEMMTYSQKSRGVGSMLPTKHMSKEAIAQDRH